MNIPNRIFYKIKRVKVKIKNRREAARKLETSEEMAINIFQNLMRSQDTVCHIAPLTGERIAENTELSIMAILSAQRITIINSTYQYDIPIGISSTDWMKDRFDQLCERRALMAKNRWNRKVNKSLDQILENLKSLDSRS